jgi:hypothetical protein
MILGFACNQLNKMINDSKEELLTFIRQLFDNYKIKNFYFILSNDIDINDDGIPCIYSLKIPSTKKFSIFSTEYRRKDLQEITQNIDDYLRTSLETRKELYNLIGYEKVIDIRSPENECERKINPKIIVVVLDETLLDDLTVAEKRLFGI